MLDWVTLIRIFGELKTDKSGGENGPHAYTDSVHVFFGDHQGGRQVDAPAGDGVGDWIPRRPVFFGECSVGL